MTSNVHLLGDIETKQFSLMEFGIFCMDLLLRLFLYHGDHFYSLFLSLFLSLCRFNKRDFDFPSLAAYNDYLEKIEEIGKVKAWMHGLGLPIRLRPRNLSLGFSPGPTRVRYPAWTQAGPLHMPTVVPEASCEPARSPVRL